MRGFLFVFSILGVMGLAFWAYQENYRTQQSLGEVRQLHSNIGAAHQRLNVLKAEWAYLNRPDRLRELADLNFDTLGLITLQAEHFGDIEQVAYPKLNLLDLTKTVDTSASDDVLTTINPDAPDQKDAQ